MQEKKNILTYEGLRKYEEELHDLKVVKRQFKEEANGNDDWTSNGIRSR